MDDKARLTAPLAILVTVVLGRSYSPMPDVEGPAAPSDAPGPFAAASSVTGRFEGMLKCRPIGRSEQRTSLEERVQVMKSSWNEVQAID